MAVTTHNGRTFDRRVHFDEKSRAFPIRTVIGPVARVPKQWRPGMTLDQGEEGTCVGHGWEAELLASPVRVKVADAAAGHQQAVGIYERAKQLDDEPGEAYEGTSVIAGAKVLVERGYMAEYRWAFGIDDLIDAVVAHGPVVVGTDWHDGMYQTRPSGLIEVGGPVVGGHCWLIYGYHPAMRIRGEDWKARYEVLRMRNSWGPTYGLGGSGLIKVEDMDALLKAQGECCVPTRRAYGPAAA